MSKSKKNENPTEPVPAIAAQELIHRSPDELKPYEGNARVHDEKQLTSLMASMREFGFTSPIITNEENMVLCGHGRLEAAKRLGLTVLAQL